MNKNKIIIIIGTIIGISLIGLFLLTGRARTDIYLKSFELSADKKTMTIKIGVSSSSGYVRKMKRTAGGMNYSFTFYSTFGINSKLGSKDTFKIELDDNVDEIYFYTGNKGYKKVLEKTDTGKWVKVNENNCQHKPTLIATEKDYKIYEYCLTNEKITINKKQYLVSEYLKTNSDESSIKKIINTLKLKDTYLDGGTKIYKGNNLTLIKCNTLDGNKDIYVGNKNMKYKQNFCKDNNETFVRTYLVEDVKKYTKQQYEDNIPVSYSNSFQVKLTDHQGKTAIVIINNLWDIKLEPGKTYEFEFMFEEDLPNKTDSIDYIFKNAYLVEVR